MPPRRPLTKYANVALESVLLCVLSTIAFVAAYYRAFSAAKPFDDEGLLVTALRRVLAGNILYDHVPSIYGPAYFIYEAIAHRLMGSAPSNDSVRLVSIAFWTLTALLCWVLVRKITGSVALATVSFAVIFVYLQFLGEEPGHPQEMCILLAVLIAFISSMRVTSTVRMVLMGAATAVGILCKVNLGIILVLSVGWVILLATATAPVLRFFRGLWMLAILAFPAILMQPNIGMRWAQYFLLLELCSLVALLITLSGVQFDLRLSLSDAAKFGIAILAVSVVTIGLTLWMGSSGAAMLDWMLVRPRKIMGPLWYLAPDVSPFRALMALAGLGLAIAVKTYRVRTEVIVGAKLLVGTGILVLAFTHRVGAVMALGAPFLWIGLISYPGKMLVRRFDRAVLCFLAVTLVLYAYPVAGAQTRFVDVLLIVTAVANLGDLKPWFDALCPVWCRKALSALAITAASGLVLYAAVDGRANYATLQSLNLPGAQRLRLPAEKARALDDIVRLARASCSTLVTIPGMPSFNLWTGVGEFQALRSGMSHEILRSGTWATGQDDEVQRRAVATLDQMPRVCIVYNRQAMDFWIHSTDVQERPIIQFMNRKFQVLKDGGDNRLLVRSQSSM